MLSGRRPRDASKLGGLTKQYRLRIAFPDKLSAAIMRAHPLSNLYLQTTTERSLLKATRLSRELTITDYTRKIQQSRFGYLRHCQLVETSGGNFISHLHPHVLYYRDLHPSMNKLLLFPSFSRELHQKRGQAQLSTQ